MSHDERPTAIPDDLAACQAIIAQLSAECRSHVHTIESHERAIAELARKNEAIEREKAELALALAEALQRAFQKRSERYLADPKQMKIDFGDSPDVADATEGLIQAIEERELLVPEHTRRQRVRKPRREQLPEHLPRYEVEATVPEAMRDCPEHGPRTVIGYDTTETLEFERPKLRVRVTKYPKFACPAQPTCGVASPERPTTLVEGDRYDTSVAAEIITGKYGYHLPIYREQDYFAGCGWIPSRSTLLNLLTAAAFVIRPLIEYFTRELLASGRTATDDTHVTLLLPRDGHHNLPPPIAGDSRSERRHDVLSEAIAAGKPSVTARMWAYRGLTVPLNVFDFTVSRHRDGPDSFLRGFCGTLLGDCYSGYEAIALRSEGAITRAACVAHARRKVFDARDVYPREASWLLARFQQLYDLETRAKAMSPAERQSLRQTEAAPIWTAIDEWLQSPPAIDVVPKSKLGEALRYLRNHWTPLRVYLSDGLLPIDNNETEQLMKQIALGRKNWLFIGSVAAGERAADLMSLVSSALRNDLDVWSYVKDVLDQLLAGETNYAALRPDVWQAAHPTSIREYRVAERRDRADRQQFRRLTRQPPEA